MAEEQILDENLQLKIKIVSLFRSGGWNLYEEKLLELKSCFEAEMASLLTECVNSEKMALLNMRLGKLQALNAVLAIKDELLEQITPDDGDTSEEVPKE